MHYLFFLHILINIIMNLNTFCINVHYVHFHAATEKEGSRDQYCYIYSLCIFLMSVTLLFLPCILLNNFRNLVLLEFGDLDLIFKVTPAP